MRSKYFKVTSIIYLMLLSILCSSIVMAQKKPTSLKLDVDIDDGEICKQKPLEGTEFCTLYATYKENKDGNAEGLFKAKKARNEMIGLVRGQVDIFYKQRKDGRSTKIRFFQTILDFLRIGGEFAVTIMNGERAKTIVGAALGGLNSGQSAFNKNFQILQTQVLINKMNTKRAEIMTEIIKKKSNNIEDYSWYDAKTDLRNYLFAGTFDNALDTLVEETGADVKRAEEELKAAQKPASESNVSESKIANKNLVQLGKQLKGSQSDKDSATKTLRGVVKKLQENTEITALLAKKGVIATSEGQSIWDALFQLRGELTRRTDLEVLINSAILESDQ